MALWVMLFLMMAFDPAYAQQKAWEKEWNDAMAGAKKEGKIVVATSPDPVMREIAAKFKARFGVTLDEFDTDAEPLRFGQLRRFAQ